MREYTSKKRVDKIVNVINKMCEDQGLYSKTIRVWGKMNNGLWCFSDINNRPIYSAGLKTKEVLSFLFGYFNAIKVTMIEDTDYMAYYKNKPKEPS